MRSRQSLRAGQATTAKRLRWHAAEASSCAAPTGQVDQCKEKNPDQVDEVPIKSGNRNWRMIIQRIPVLACSPGNREQHDNAYADMQRMQAGRGEIEEEEEDGAARMRHIELKVERGDKMLAEFLEILIAFEAEKHGAEQSGAKEKSCGQTART